MLGKMTTFCASIVILLSVTSLVKSQDNDPSAKETWRQTLRQSCDTLVISASVVIVNCSFMAVDQMDSIRNIDSRVTTLDLSSSQLEKLPVLEDQENPFPYLVHLNLSHNTLSMDDDFRNGIAQNVRYLDLTQNQLTTFPQCGSSLMSMELDSNKITSIDVGVDIVACGKLRHLSLARNLLHNFSSSCESQTVGSSSLEELDLSSNRIEQLGNCAFDLLDKLLHLNLSNNAITHLPEDIFRNLTMLEKLDISHNDISYIATGSIEIMKDLKYLDMSYNKLKTLPTSLPMMDWFDASFNIITALPETFSSVLYPQSVFLLGGNPFVCNCDLLWLKEFFDTRKYLLKFLKTLDRVKFIPECNSPEKLQGISWDDLEDTKFECSGLEDAETKLIKENIEQVLSGKDLIEAGEIGDHFVMLQWNVPPDLSKSIELTYHKFGQKKHKKEIVLPSSVTSYRLKKLESGTPYVICLTVTLSNELSDCIEVVTDLSEDVDWSYKLFIALQHIMGVCHSRFDIIILSVGIITLLYYFFLRETVTTEAENK